MRPTYKVYVRKPFAAEWMEQRQDLEKYGPAASFMINHVEKQAERLVLPIGIWLRENDAFGHVITGYNATDAMTGNGWVWVVELDDPAIAMLLRLSI